MTEGFENMNIWESYVGISPKAYESDEFVIKNLIEDKVIQSPTITLDYELDMNGMKTQNLVFGGVNLTKVHSESLIKLTSTRLDTFSLDVGDIKVLGDKVTEGKIDAIIDTTSELVLVPSNMFHEI